MKVAADLNLEELARLLAELARINERHFRERPELIDLFWGRLLRGELVYTFEDGDEWADVLQVLEEGRFDCEDIAAIIAAIMKIWGYRAEVAVGQRKRSKGAHAFDRINRVLFDYCPAAGMGSPRDGAIYERAVFIEV